MTELVSKDRQTVKTIVARQLLQKSMAAERMKTTDNNDSTHSSI